MLGGFWAFHCAHGAFALQPPPAATSTFSYCSHGDVVWLSLGRPKRFFLGRLQFFLQGQMILRSQVSLWRNTKCHIDYVQYLFTGDFLLISKAHLSHQKADAFMLALILKFDWNFSSKRHSKKKKKRGKSREMFYERWKPVQGQAGMEETIAVVKGNNEDSWQARKCK